MIYEDERLVDGNGMMIRFVYGIVLRDESYKL